MAGAVACPRAGRLINDGSPTAGGKAWPATRHSVLEALAGPDPAARDAARDLLVRAYWRPVYATLRLGHGFDPDEAEDLTQDFLVEALEKAWLERHDPARARFRTWMRTCLRGFVGHHRRAQGRLKRGGAQVHLPLAAAEVEMGLAAGSAAEDPFDHEWARSIIDLALERLEARCLAAGHAERWAAFRRYDVEGAAADRRPTYAEVAAALGLPVTQVTNHLHWCRRAFREEVLATLRSVTASEAEYQVEVGALLGGVS